MTNILFIKNELRMFAKDTNRGMIRNVQFRTRVLV